MSADKSQRPQEADRDADLPIEDLNAKEVEEKAADQTRGGARPNEFNITKTTDTASPS
jgi:hypothetical protein